MPVATANTTAAEPKEPLVVADQPFDRVRAFGPAVAVTIAVVAVCLEFGDIWVTAQLPPADYTPLPFAPEDMAGTAFPAFGALLVISRPRLLLGWLLCLGGLGSAANILAVNLAGLLVQNGGHPAVHPLWVFADGVWNLTTYALGILLPLLYPTGRILSKRWCVPGAFAASALALDWVCVLIGPSSVRTGHNPWEITAFAPYFQSTRGVLNTVVTAAMALAFFSLVVRFRKAGPVERRQILWPLVAIAGLVTPWVIGPPLWWVASLTIPLVPAAIAVAVLRYRLYGIDTLISRTIVGVGLVSAIAAVYLLVTAGSSLILSGVDRFAGLAAALFAGAFFHPIRRGLQRVVDRALYGSRGDPMALAAGLRRRLQQTDPAHGLLAALEALREGLSVTGIAVEAEGTTTTAGEVGHVTREIALVWHGEPVGRMLIGPPGRRRFPAAHDERVIGVLTPYVADAAHTMRLTNDLRRSRQRILTAREEERRRLRRDLHDGLGQTLSAMAMTLNLARLNLERSPGTADRLLQDLRGGMDAVSADVRQLVYGLRPPALDDLGLVAAIRALAEEVRPDLDLGEDGTVHRSGGGIVVEAHGPAVLPEGPGTTAGDGAVEGHRELDGLPAAVEVAAYRIVQEALTNVRKHARARHVRVTLRLDDELLVVVADDGVGLPRDRRAGVGLFSMAERAAELGGTCAVTSAPGEGTTVTARLPAGYAPQASVSPTDVRR
ncbi:sensor histidine kinase [Planotetraspora sp. A-T 1434]|uniref:sensor histidine kinase n=1 Tax=Planotetraspora sp. A-T 1434 TaxID=2979219 RepID=UPI0021C1E911|nr:sensor histidine kinase [Planotetraspora sp. A-T 1434]MCT9930042.1 sensor histidine kinase [Planotetraspora sp. A-T 1434]